MTSLQSMGSPAEEAEESSQKPDEEVTETTAMLGNEEEVKHIGTIEAWSRGGLTNKCACQGAPDFVTLLITIFSVLMMLVTFPFSLIFVIKVVAEYERAVVYRLGLTLPGGVRGPGLIFLIPCIDDYEKIDMRTQTFNVPPQEILTKDSVTVFVNAVMYYRVSDAESAVNE